jgi:hypothetical protein
MPLEMKPPINELPPVKRVTPDGLDSEGPAAEWVEIPKIFDESANKQAREEATTKTQKGNRPVVEEFDQEKYRKTLIVLNVRSWRLIVPPGRAFNEQTMEQADDNYFWKFIPENIETLPPDFVVWLSTEILSVSSVIPTESLLVTTKSGKRILDFRRQGAGVCEGEGQGNLDPLGSGSVPQGKSRHRVSGNR